MPSLAFVDGYAFISKESIGGHSSDYRFSKSEGSAVGRAFTINRFKVEMAAVALSTYNAELKFSYQSI